MAGGSKLERDFQAKLIMELKVRFQGCMVLKNDSSYIQGIPDLLVLYKDRWATLECHIYHGLSPTYTQVVSIVPALLPKNVRFYDTDNIVNALEYQKIVV